MNAVTEYLERAGLSGLVPPDLVAACRDTLQEVAAATAVPVELEALYHYPVPLLGEGGACSLVNQLAPEPYDLRQVLKAGPATEYRLAVLNALVEVTQQRAAIGWLGVYQARTSRSGRALIKLAYRGKPSRAEFPLTEEFAAYSNNSTVGLTGQARLIADVGAHQRQGGSYYNCDPAVQSEACLPLLDQAGRVVGILDGEDSRLDRFTDTPLAWLAGLALVAVQWLPE
ncbi:GAF domain-containing protein [Chitinimonas lacunae]|uniref:GAF domain-containing protein n=1 Tax=Chitinimonas lacunae TaxID=1963018 RepID=A0ABV8MVL4_9NEIS